jgi:hypothetical protein
LLNREAGVINTAVFKELLFGFLDFNDEVFTGWAGAIQIKHRTAIELGGAEFFVMGEVECLDLMFLRQ